VETAEESSFILKCSFASERKEAEVRVEWLACRHTEDEVRQEERESDVACARESHRGIDRFLPPNLSPKNVRSNSVHAL